jgi:hypothetical protein
MDRTDEFHNIFRSDGQGGRNLQIIEPIEAKAESSSRNTFNAEASKIGNEIHLAQLRLDELGRRMPLIIPCSHHSSCSPEGCFQ